jgi:hypothetical protein
VKFFWLQIASGRVAIAHARPNGYPTALVELKDDREIYLVMPGLAPELPGEIFTATLHLAINRQGVVFLWPTRVPPPTVATWTGGELLPKLPSWLRRVGLD